MRTLPQNILAATYTSVFDDGAVVCTSDCYYDTETLQCFSIEDAENAEEAENANALTDEYVTIHQVENGIVQTVEFRKKDNVSFLY